MIDLDKGDAFVWPEGHPEMSRQVFLATKQGEAVLVYVAGLLARGFSRYLIGDTQDSSVFEIWSFEQEMPNRCVLYGSVQPAMVADEITVIPEFDTVESAEAWMDERASRLSGPIG